MPRSLNPIDPEGLRRANEQFAKIQEGQISMRQQELSRELETLKLLREILAELKEINSKLP